jgi:hypothetical protein
MQKNEHQKLKSWLQVRQKLRVESQVSIDNIEHRHLKLAIEISMTKFTHWHGHEHSHVLRHGHSPCPSPDPSMSMSCSSSCVILQCLLYFNGQLLEHTWIWQTQTRAKYIFKLMNMLRLMACSGLWQVHAQAHGHGQGFGDRGTDLDKLKG